MLKEFKEFAMRGNVLDMAVGIIIGAAFGRIVTSFVEDILMPPLGKLIGPVDFSSRFISLSSKHYDTIAAAKYGQSGDAELRNVSKQRHQLSDCRLRYIPSRAHRESLDH